MSRRIIVYGPAYLDRVLRVAGRLLDPRLGPPLDLSVEGQLEPGEGLRLLDPSGGSLVIELPDAWPGPWGTIRLSRELCPGSPGWSRHVRATSWHDDLGGMGAGYAAALGGTLISALGAEDDPASRAISALLERAGVRHQPIRVPARPADWTLLITSGEHGDKLPVGFRGCHDAIEALPEPAACDLRVVASLPNRLAAQALTAGGAKVRFFAPALRNVSDRLAPIARFAQAIDVLCCNRQEWERLDNREAVARRLSLLAVTDGPAGAAIRFRGPDGSWREHRCAAFPRLGPPRDTNRAGEAFASTLVSTLLEGGWEPDQPADPALIVRAARRAAASAALVLDRTDFGFAAPAEIDRALERGVVGEA
jgi:sugar/nucleoside kinase (ribokinase family)